ncbi:Sedlin, N-terminal conserved region-domain-containing protein [Melanogaster broomeanus]|nr:Sedlin, N-terminal conserved region-domain-containing protein [Melanogaster broomeanus]
MPPPLRLNAVAFISPQNHPILIRTFQAGDELKYHYVAHTSLDVIEERVGGTTKSTDCYLGLLYAMDEVAAYGYVTPLKVKIVLALPLTDSVVRDAEVIMTFKALHMAFYQAVSNPFLKLEASSESPNDQFSYLAVGSAKWKTFRRRVDDITRALGNHIPSP